MFTGESRFINNFSYVVFCNTHINPMATLSQLVGWAVTVCRSIGQSVNGLVSQSVCQSVSVLSNDNFFLLKYNFPRQKPKVRRMQQRNHAIY